MLTLLLVVIKRPSVYKCATNLLGIIENSEQGEMGETLGS